MLDPFRLRPVALGTDSYTPGDAPTRLTASGGLVSSGILALLAAVVFGWGVLSARLERAGAKAMLVVR